MSDTFITRNLKLLAAKSLINGVQKILPQYAQRYGYTLEALPPIPDDYGFITERGGVDRPSPPDISKLSLLGLKKIVETYFKAERRFHQIVSGLCKEKLVGFYNTLPYEKRHMYHLPYFKKLHEENIRSRELSFIQSQFLNEFPQLDILQIRNLDKGDHYYWPLVHCYLPDPIRPLSCKNTEQDYYAYLRHSIFNTHPTYKLIIFVKQYLEKNTSTKKPLTLGSIPSNFDFLGGYFLALFSCYITVMKLIICLEEDNQDFSKIKGPASLQSIQEQAIRLQHSYNTKNPELTNLFNYHEWLKEVQTTHANKLFIAEISRQRDIVSTGRAAIDQINRLLLPSP